MTEKLQKQYSSVILFQIIDKVIIKDDTMCSWDVERTNEIVTYAE